MNRCGKRLSRISWKLLVSEKTSHKHQVKGAHREVYSIVRVNGSLIVGRPQLNPGHHGGERPGACCHCPVPEGVCSWLLGGQGRGVRCRPMPVQSTPVRVRFSFNCAIYSETTPSAS